jgi:hypothetical protein
MPASWPPAGAPRVAVLFEHRLFEHPDGTGVPMEMQVDVAGAKITPRVGHSTLSFDSIIPSTDSAGGRRLFDNELSPIARSFVADGRSATVVVLGSSFEQVQRCAGGKTAGNGGWGPLQMLLNAVVCAPQPRGGPALPPPWSVTVTVVTDQPAVARSQPAPVARMRPLTLPLMAVADIAVICEAVQQRAVEVWGSPAHRGGRHLIFSIARAATGHAQATGAALPPNIAAIFGRIDRNGDGSVTRAELIRALRSDTSLQLLLGLPGQVRRQPHARSSRGSVCGCPVGMVWGRWGTSNARCLNGSSRVWTLTTTEVSAWTSSLLTYGARIVQSGMGL